MWHQEWCGPCKNAEVDIKQRRQELNNIGFEEVDPDDLKTQDEQMFFKNEEIRVYPTFVIYARFSLGQHLILKELGRFEGYNDFEEFKTRVFSIINKRCR